jgi:hypothetical protein
MKEGLGFSPSMILIVVLAFVGISFFMGILVHSSFMYKDQSNLKSDSDKAWTLSMIAGIGITVWMFGYGFYMNLL